MTVAAAMSHSYTPSQSPSKKRTSARSQHSVDPRLALARIIQFQRLQREQALRLRPEPHTYIPRMDLYDDEDQPHVAAMLELPGVDRRNLTLHVESGKLVVHGERGSPLSARMLAIGSAAPGTFTPRHFKMRELKFGSFHREIDIPDGIETKHINAELNNGMLLITWPRKPESGDVPTIKTS